ncbi:GntR family transcriptional regulator [Arcticibacter tournemirensis]
MDFKIDTKSSVPVYKQLIQAVQKAIDNGEISDQEFLPSMNVLSETLDISKETVKKAYSILREQGYLESSHGKGFYVNKRYKHKLKVLVLFDMLSTYKLVLYRSFVETLDKGTEISILFHNQDIKIFRKQIEENLNTFDYYVVSPNFNMDGGIQKEVLQILKKIPNRKLILLDRLVSPLQGNFGAVYQDFEQDVYEGLSQGQKLIKKYKKINILSTSGSLYAEFIIKGIKKFCNEHRIEHKQFKSIDTNEINKEEVYIILNSQHDKELFDILRTTKEKKLKLGKEIGVISYNESPINEFILNGLTVLSTDFKEMGRIAGEMVKTGALSKVRNKFSLIIRKSL